MMHSIIEKVTWWLIALPETCVEFPGSLNGYRCELEQEAGLSIQN